MPKLSAHLQAQVLRFIRLFVLAFAATGVLASASLGKDAIVAAAVGALETAWRQINQVAPVAPAVPAAPVDPPAAP